MPSTSPKPNKATENNSLIDQATRLVKKFCIYLVSFSTMVGSWYVLHDKLHIAEKYIYILVSIPFFLVLFFDILPDQYQKRRNKHLTQFGISGTVNHADYFRLQPYDSSDYDHFNRTDNAHHKILAWLKSANSPWLYLTGLSGSGKSSLLQAFVIPEFKKQGDSVLVIRSFSDPLNALQQELQRPDVIWKNPPKHDMPLVQLLQSACSYLKQHRLLIVFDQFEEFVILQQTESHQAMKAFLQQFDTNIPSNLQILAVVRTDYLDNLLNLEIPQRFEFKQSNARGVEPFTLANARQFLQNSGLALDPVLLEKVLVEAIELEETPGLIRPITLNILGVVLTWFSNGGRLPKKQTGQLIRAYLLAALNEFGDYAPLIVAKLISDASTKSPPRTESELQSLTHLNRGIVRGCLMQLSTKGLVRELDKGIWEISHDFIAKLLASIIWKFRVKWWKRCLPYLSSATLFLWLIALVFVDSFYRVRSFENAFAVLAYAGVPIGPESQWFGDHNESKLTAHIEDRNERDFISNYFGYLQTIGSQIEALKIHGNHGIREIPSLNEFTQLQFLSIKGNPNLGDLPAFDHLTQLRTLELGNIEEDLQIPIFDQLTQLQVLEISHRWNDPCFKVKPLPSFDKLTQLKELVITMTCLNQLPSLDKLTQLKDFRIENNDKLIKLPSLKNLHQLKSLYLGYHESELLDINEIESLASLQNITLMGDVKGTFLNQLNEWRKKHNLPVVIDPREMNEISPVMSN